MKQYLSYLEPSKAFNSSNLISGVFSLIRVGLALSLFLLLTGCAPKENTPTSTSQLLFSPGNKTEQTSPAAGATTPEPTLATIPIHTWQPVLSASPVVASTPTAAPTTAPTGIWQNISPAGVSTSFDNPPSNYGFQTIALEPQSGAIYVGTCNQGLWKSNDQGKTWGKVNTGQNGASLDGGRLWSLAVDPVNPRIIYTTAGYGGGGILKSTNGGVDWTDMIPAGSALQNAVESADIYSIAIDPYNHEHILATFHSVFNGPYTGNAPVIESLDGGNNWTVLPLPGLGYGHYIFFMDNSSTWLLATQEGGFWRTTNAGKNWNQVATTNMSHGAGSLYRAKNGVWYTAAFNTVLRSPDGVNWTDVGPRLGDYLYSVIGDGNNLYTLSGNTGTNTTGPLPFYTSPETDGLNWTPMSTQTFNNGPMSMVYDRTNRLIYSSNWLAGVWKLPV